MNAMLPLATGMLSLGMSLYPNHVSAYFDRIKNKNMWVFFAYISLFVFYPFISVPFSCTLLILLSLSDMIYKSKNKIHES